MPPKVKRLKGGGYRVTTPEGTTAKKTTKRKAEAQAKLLRGIEHGWRPTGKTAQRKRGRA